MSHEAYGSATSISRLLNNNKAPHALHDVVPEQYHSPEPPFVLDRRANATIVMLARNGDIQGVIKSIKQMEDRFNKRFRYPYVFLNEQPFSDVFIEYVTLLIVAYYTPLTAVAIRHGRRVTQLTDSTVEFGLIPPDHWHQPDWIDEEQASAARAKMEENRVIYGGAYKACYSPPRRDTRTRPTLFSGSLP